MRLSARAKLVISPFSILPFPFGAAVGLEAGVVVGGIGVAVGGSGVTVGGIGVAVGGTGVGVGGTGVAVGGTSVGGIGVAVGAAAGAPQAASSNNTIRMAQTAIHLRFVFRFLVNMFASLRCLVSIIVT